RWVTREDIAERKGVGIRTVNLWVKDGLLAPAVSYNQKKFFDKESVEAFCNNYLRTAEVVKLLGVWDTTIAAWINSGRLTPVYRKSNDHLGVNLFKREDVEKLSASNYLDAPQMAKRLGLSYSGLMARIRSGKVRPVSGPGVDTYGR